MMFNKWVKSLQENKGVQFPYDNFKENDQVGVKWCTVVTWSGNVNVIVSLKYIVNIIIYLLNRGGGRG